MTGACLTSLRDRRVFDQSAASSAAFVFLSKGLFHGDWSGAPSRPHPFDQFRPWSNGSNWTNVFLSDGLARSGWSALPSI